MKLKNNIGSLQIKGLGITLNQNSTEEQIKRALKHRPELAQYIEGATKPKTDKP